MTYLTEEQATEMRCCGPNGCGKQTLHSELQFCVGSICMAWRWSRVKETSAFLTAVKEHMKATGENFNKATQAVYADADKYRHTEGYCGLAGKPEGGE